MVHFRSTLWYSPERVKLSLFLNAQHHSSLLQHLKVVCNLHLHGDYGRPTTISYIAWLYVILLNFFSCYAFLAQPCPRKPLYTTQSQWQTHNTSTDCSHAKNDSNSAFALQKQERLCWRFLKSRKSQDGMIWEVFVTIGITVALF